MIATSINAPAARGTRAWSLMRIGLTAILGIIIGCLLVAVIATNFLGYHALSVQSDSMIPELNRGDLIITRSVPINDVHVGDIVLFQEGHEIPVLVAHRVVDITTRTVNTTQTSSGITTQATSQILWTKGDANTTPDPVPVEEGSFRGLVFYTVPGVGAFLGTSGFRLMMTAVAVLSLAGWMLYEAYRFAGRRMRQAG